MSVLIDLFISFFKIGAFSFGGGFAMIPFIQEEVINARGWVSQAEFLDMIAISQVTPGPIAINSATFIGSRVAGMIGGAVCTFAVILPSFIVVMTLVLALKRVGKSRLMNSIYAGLRPVVMALIFSALISVGRASIFDWEGLAIAVIAFILLMTKKVNMIVVLVLAGLAGYILY